jgi:hypothetical protein
MIVVPTTRRRSIAAEADVEILVVLLSHVAGALGDCDHSDPRSTGRSDGLGESLPK